MVHETVTTLAGPEVLRRAKAFFAERMPQSAAFPESEGPGIPDPPRAGGRGDRPGRVRRRRAARGCAASTLFFDQAVARFLSTLPTPVVVAA